MTKKASNGNSNGKNAVTGRFEKGHKLAKGRPAGSENAIPAELKDILVRAYMHRGGFEKFCKWIDKCDANETLFYSKMWIRMLPMNITVESKKDVVYRSYHELAVAFQDQGVSLDSIEKLKQLDLQALPRPKDDK